MELPGKETAGETEGGAAMGKASEIWRRAGMLARRGSLRGSWNEEMRLHRELKENALIVDGVEAPEARFAANRAFGNVTTLRERGREAWGLGMDRALGAGRQLRGARDAAEPGGPRWLHCSHLPWGSARTARFLAWPTR